jgi:hypothetical protein
MKPTASKTSIASQKEAIARIDSLLESITQIPTILESIHDVLVTDKNEPTEHWIPALQAIQETASFDETLIGAALKLYLRDQLLWSAVENESWSSLDDDGWFFLASEILHSQS